jgi:ribosomal protein S18 acetylase RimI-like enzyme
MCEQLRLRKALASDYVEICAWITDAATCRQWAGPSIAFPLHADRLQADLAKDGQESFSLVDGERVLAFGQYWAIEPGAVHIGRVIVSPYSRDRGIDRCVVQTLIARAVASTGADRVTLRVASGNARAQKLYERMGFQRVAERSSADVLFMQRCV